MTYTKYRWFGIAHSQSDMPTERLTALWDQCMKAVDLPGSIMQLGVYKGGSAVLLCEAFPNRTVHLFDTFTGMPAIQQDIDDNQPGVFGDTSLEEVQERLKEYPNAVLHPGLFSETCFVLDDAGLSFVHLDCDLYLSTKQGLECCWPKLLPGGVIVCDDYGCPSCRGATLAWDQFDFGGAEQERLGRVGVAACKP